MGRWESMSIQNCLTDGNENSQFVDDTLIVDDREQARGYSRARDEGEGDDAQQRRGVVHRRLREVGRERKCELGHIMDVAVNGEDEMRDARRSSGWTSGTTWRSPHARPGPCTRR